MNDERRRRLTKAKVQVQDAIEIITDLCEKERNAAERGHPKHDKTDELEDVLSGLTEVESKLIELGK